MISTGRVAGAFCERCAFGFATSRGLIAPPPALLEVAIIRSNSAGTSLACVAGVSAGSPGCVSGSKTGADLLP